MATPDPPGHACRDGSADYRRARRASQRIQAGFAQIEQVTGRVVGSTTYLDISRRDRRLEIGSTWIGKPWQRTGVNTEAKYLLLRHGFEDLGAVRVQLKTDKRNLQSQAAIERLGAVREGVLRKHMLVHDGVIRDTVMYSIIADEWPSVKQRLEAKLAAYPIKTL